MGRLHMNCSHRATSGFLNALDEVSFLDQLFFVQSISLELDFDTNLFSTVSNA